MAPSAPAPSLPVVDESAAVRRVIELIGIPGKSGLESAVANAIVAKLRDAGLPESAISYDDANKRSPLGGEIGNLIVKFPGTRRGPRRLLMAHLDTVPLCVGSQPVRDGDLIRSADPATALGGDDRGGATVVLTAALEILRQKLPHPPLTFFWPVQEEVGLYGARFVSISKLGGPQLCFNWDGGAPDVACIGATGDYSLEIAIHGVASHAGVHPEQGVSAIAVAALAIADLQEQGWHGLVLKGKKRGSSNIGVIAGGDATNVVTPLVRLRGEVRSHEPKFRQRLVREFEKAFQRAVKKIRSSEKRTARLDFQAELKYESFRLGPEEPSVVEALRVLTSLGIEPQTRISNGGLDANWLTSHGLPTVTLGCGQDDVHTTNETLHVPSFLTACRVALGLACGAG